MKKSILIVILLTFAISCNKRLCRINGSTDSSAPIVVISDINDEYEQLSTEITDDGKFNFEIEIDESYPAMVFIDSSHMACIYMEPGNIDLECFENGNKISGTESNDLIGREENPLELFENNKSSSLGLIGIYLYMISNSGNCNITELLDSNTCQQIRQSRYITECLNRERISGKRFTDIISDDGSTSLASIIKGKTAIVYFCASWSMKFRDDVCNHLIAALEKYPDIVIVAIDVNDNRDNFIDTAEKLGINFPIIFDIEGNSLDIYGVENIPHILLVDSNGIVINGNLRSEEIENVLKQMRKDD